MENETDQENGDGVHEDPTAVGPDTQPVPVVTTTAEPPPSPGWYLDPWDHAQHRYWDGGAWTAETFPNGPGPAAPFAPYWREVPQRLDGASTPPPPPSWTPAPADLPPTPSAPPQESPRRNGRALAGVALVIGLIVGFVIAFAAGTAARHSGTSRSAAAPLTVVPPAPATIPIPPNVNPTPSTTVPNPGGSPASSDPSAAALQSLVLRTADVGPNLTVQQIARGDQVAGEVTLDLCNASFPSEALRTARLQVAAVDANGDAPVSTEAVLYAKPGGSAQAFTELRAAAAGCPAGPTTGAAGDTTTTHMNPAPDGSWPATPTVERLAFDFTSTDQRGQSQHFVAVYLRRGRALEGVYFSSPDGPQSPIAGQSTIPSIVGVLAGRMAQLSPAVVNG